MRIIIPPLLALFLSLLPLVSTYGQTNTTFENGEILLDNSQVLSGYIWIVDNASGLKKVYYKPDAKGLVSEYSALDLVSINLLSGKRLIVSEAIPTSAGTARKLAEVHFRGDLTLLSITYSGQRTYYIIDTEGNVTEMVNSYNVPGQAGNYDLSFNNEYKEVLRALLIDESEYEKLMESTEYSAKSISQLLKKYHSANKYEYNIYPPPRFSGFFGAGASLMFMQHQSDINQDFVSVSPFGGVSLIAGLKTSGGLFEFSYEPTFIWGTIYHDNMNEESVNLKSYYEDIAKTSILINSLNIAIIPKKSGKFSPMVGFGISYNSWLAYSREVTEELYYEDSGLVLNYFYNDFDKPEPYFGTSARAGITYHLEGSNYLRAAYTYNTYFGIDAGPQALHAAIISFIYNIH